MNKLSKELVRIAEEVGGMDKHKVARDAFELVQNALVGFKEMRLLIDEAWENTKSYEDDNVFDELRDEIYRNYESMWRRIGNDFGRVKKVVNTDFSEKDYEMIIKSGLKKIDKTLMQYEHLIWGDIEDLTNYYARLTQDDLLDAANKEGRDSWEICINSPIWAQIYS